MKSQEIAKIAGVSRSTVSRVINNYPNVPEATRKKVMKVIEEYNYSPNSFARTLAGKKSQTIGVFLIILGHENDDQIFSNDYFASLLELLVDEAAKKDYYILTSVIKENSNYSKIYQAFAEKRIDGGIIIGTKLNTLEMIKASDIESNLVIFDYELSDEEKKLYHKTKISTLNINDEKGIEESVGFLYKNGHRNIGFIKGRDISRSGHIRYEAYKSAMGKYNIGINDSYVLNGDFSSLKAYRLVKEKIRSKELPTAYICANDSMAYAAIKALKEQGVKVPEEISIIGFDNTQKAIEIEPHLTTLGPDYIAMSKTAIDILDTQIHEQNAKPCFLEYDAKLHVRATTNK